MRNERRAQKHVRRHLNKLSRKCWRDFCTRLDPRLPLSQIWRIMRSLRTKKEQQQSFRALALSKQISEQTCAEDFCTTITRQTTMRVATLNDQCNAALLMPSTSLDADFTFQELAVALSSCVRSPSPGPDGITYATLTHLGLKAKRQLLHFYNLSWKLGSVQKN